MEVTQKRARKMNPNSMANLKDRSAPDKPKNVAPITVQVTVEQKEWLDSQPESRSYHVRQAMKMYLEYLAVQLKQ
ncbi:hypothetical protein F7734_53430 [Scytonema sp. UIC 10036]|uniref:hypothetical protein n=1 Tax=Scytonema sp. UIC 10036 TaxID=2304196 RepID=UPI0012DA786D|nr:hypothetical protein [Scytonema sp. UIC 10036]MUH00612.1 hypothetical protein [Scytonema sp. UIC 10036]